MSKRVLNQVLLVTAFIYSSIGFAQPALTRTTFTGTYTPISISGGANASSAMGDNAYQDFIPLGFTFNYLGTNYTTIGVSTNGVAAFTGISASATNTDLYTTTAPNTVLAPWWDDLLVANGVGSILYQTQGAAGSRKFTVQWTDVYSYSSGSSARLNFQLVLSETSNTIEFRYGFAPSGTFNTSESACIGVKNATGGSGAFIDAVTGSSFTGNAMIHASAMWPSRFFRFAPGLPSPIAPGLYTVGLATGDYPSLSEAVADLNHRGVSGNGAVTFSLLDTLFDATPAHGGNFFPVLIGPVANTSIASSVVFQGVHSDPALIQSPGAQAGTCANKASTAAITTSNEPIIAFVGARHCGLMHMKLESTSSLVDRGLSMLSASATEGTRNCGISFLYVVLDRTNTNTIGLEQREPVAPTAPSGANSFNVYQVVSISNSYSGMFFQGNATYPDSSCTISTNSSMVLNMIGGATANDIGNGTLPAFGVRVSNQSGISVSNVMVRNVSTNGAASCDGIILDNLRGLSQLYGCKIYNLRNNSNSATDEVTGIRASVPNGSNTIRIYNNFICELHSSYNGSASAARQMRGIFVQPTGGGNSSGEIDVDFNNILMNPSSLGMSNCCLEIGTTTGPVIRVRNNIFYQGTANQNSPSGHYCWISNASNITGNTGSVSDNNDFFIVNSTGGFAGRGGTTDYATLSSWQAAMTQDANAVQLDPQFTSATDLHVHETQLNSMGVSIPSVSTDIDGEVRATPPDIGADEIFPQDAGAVLLVSPDSTDCYSSSEPVVVRVINASPFPLDFTVDTVHITVHISGAINQTLTTELHDNSVNNSAPLGVGMTTDVLVGNANMTASGNYTFTAWTTLRGDGNHLNDSIDPVVLYNTVPVVAVSGDTQLCANQSTLLTASVTGGHAPFSYQWSTGANGSTLNFTPSSDTTIYVSVTDGCGSYSNAPIHLSVDPLPQAAFSYSMNNSTVTFTNTSSSSTGFSWDFGDSQTSSQASPVHTYTSSGTFTVTLIAQNGCGSDTTTSVINVITTGIDPSVANVLQSYPNPVTDQFTIIFATSEQHVRAELFDDTGKLMQQQDLGTIPAGGKVVIHTEGYRNGTYFLKVISDGSYHAQKILVQD